MGCQQARDSTVSPTPKG